MSPRAHHGRNRHSGPARNVRAFIADLGKLEPEARRELRKGLKQAGAAALADAKANASWSTRIPSAITLSTSTTAKSAGVYLRVNADKAPHGRPLEGLADSRTSFRHPVFGNTDVWVSQPERPFLLPAAKKGHQDAIAASQDAVRAAARTAGFR